jgi:hypothetical protein
LDQPYFDMAQICVNGHVINSNYLKNPQFNQQYCDRCGERTITQCPKCSENIKGEYEDPQSHVSVIGFWYKPPSFCEYCGKPFPWTSSAIRAARELTGTLDLTDDQKKELKKDITDMVKNTPRARVAAARFKKTLEDKYQQIPALYHDLLIAVLPAVVSHMLWPH